MATRKENEREFLNWVDLPDGGRHYWRERRGSRSGYCRYIKMVDKNDQTIRFTQEIYDDDGSLIEVHQKYPVDTGHLYVGKATDDDDSPDHS